MKDLVFRPLLSLLLFISIICFLTACGSDGSLTSTAVPDTRLAKNAAVKVAFDPTSFNRKAKKISGSTNYIQLYVTQWQVGNLNALTVINQDTETLTAANPSATLTLYPVYTRICASQYSGTPAATTAPTEVSCSFGMLNAGDNTVTLTMLTDTWTLSPVYNGFKTVALNYPNITAATTSGVSYGTYDGNANHLPGVPSQSINNWGSGYQAQLKNTGTVATEAGVTSFFNNGDSGPSFGTGADTHSAPGTINDIKTSTFIGGIGTGVGSNGLLSETKNIIWYPLNSSTPVLVSPTSTVMVQNQSGVNVTSSIFANCQLQVLSGSSIQACGIGVIKNGYTGMVSSNSDIQGGTSSNYNYKVTSTTTATGADICYLDGANAATDSSGNISCYDYDYFTNGSSISCSNGTYTNGRCQYTLNSVCTNRFSGQNSSVVYDSTTQSCTVTSVGYFLKLNSTALTLTAN
jgi:hypothetical protein